MMTNNLKEIGSYIFVIGKTLGDLSQSEFFDRISLFCLCIGDNHCNVRLEWFAN